MDDPNELYNVVFYDHPNKLTNGGFRLGLPVVWALAHNILFLVSIMDVVWIGG